MDQKGFTLLEVLMVLALVVLMIALSIAFSSRYLQRQHLRSVAESILTELRSAQTSSLGQVDNSQHGVAVFPDRVVAFTGQSYATRDPSKDEEIIFSNVVTVTNDAEVVFQSGDFKLDRDYVITIENELELLNVTISQYGVLEIQEGPI